MPKKLTHSLAFSTLHVVLEGEITQHRRVSSTSLRGNYSAHPSAPQPRQESLALRRCQFTPSRRFKVWQQKDSLVKSCTRSRSSTSSSSVGGVKPAGCFVDTLRAKPGASAGMAVRRNERVDVRNSDGRISEAIVRVERNGYEFRFPF